MIYAKNVFRAIIAISGVATAAHATPAAPINAWNEGQGHGANGRGPRGFTSRFIDTLTTDGGAGATADAVASPSNYGGKKKSQLNALRGVDSPRNTSKFATASPIGTPTNGKNGQASVKTYEEHQRQTALPPQATAKPCPKSAKTAQPTPAPTTAYGNTKGQSGHGNGKGGDDKNHSKTPTTPTTTTAYDNSKDNDKNHSKTPATPASTNAYGNGKDKGDNDKDKGKNYTKAPSTAAPTTNKGQATKAPCTGKPGGNPTPTPSKSTSGKGNGNSNGSNGGYGSNGGGVTTQAPGNHGSNGSGSGSTKGGKGKDAYKFPTPSSPQDRNYGNHGKVAYKFTTPASPKGDSHGNHGKDAYKSTTQTSKQEQTAIGKAYFQSAPTNAKAPGKKV